MANENAKLLGFSSEEVVFVAGSFADATTWGTGSSALDSWRRQQLEQEQTLEIAAVLCNPPYSSVKEVSRLSAQVIRVRNVSIAFANYYSVVRYWSHMNKL